MDVQSAHSVFRGIQMICDEIADRTRLSPNFEREAQLTDAVIAYLKRKKEYDVIRDWDMGTLSCSHICEPNHQAFVIHFNVTLFFYHSRFPSGFTVEWDDTQAPQLQVDLFR